MNHAGVEFPDVVVNWPLFHISGTRPLNLTDAAVSHFWIGSWIHEAVADLVLCPDAGDEDEDDEVIRGLQCARCSLHAPLTPTQLLQHLVAFFSCDKWYGLLAQDGVRTPSSILVPLEAGSCFGRVVPLVDRAIDTLGGRVFPRMGHASAKGVVRACTSAAEVEAKLRSSERTAARLRSIEAGTCVDGPPSGWLVLRAFVDGIESHVEMRCFVHGGAARGVTLGVPEESALSDADETLRVECLRRLRVALRRLLHRVVAATEYADCCVDVALPLAALDRLALGASHEEEAVAAAALLCSLWVVEVNTPVYLLATSGRFCLDSVAHRHVLFGEISDELVYPAVIAEFQSCRRGTSVVELVS